MKKKLISMVLAIGVLAVTFIISVSADTQDFTTVLSAWGGETTVINGTKTESYNQQNGSLYHVPSPAGRNISVHVYNASTGKDATDGGWIPVGSGGTYSIPYSRYVSTGDSLQLHAKCTNGGMYKTTLRGNMNFR